MRRISTLAIVALLCGLATARHPRWHELDGYTFEQYLKDFKKPYQPGTDGHAIRKANFEKNLAVIQEHNKDTAQSWRAGVNMFTDMSREEFKAYNRGRAMPEDYKQLASKTVGAPGPNEPPLPLTVDWRLAEPRVLTSVKHQGACGSCWAHSATEGIESQYALLTGMLPVLSVAQINSCTPNNNQYQCAGCDGGFSAGAWAYLANTSVVRPAVQKAVTEAWAYSYPIEDFFSDDHPAENSVSTSPCKDISQEWTVPASSWFAELTAAGVSGFGTVDCNSPTGAPAAMKALRDIGPQHIAIAAGNWQWYESGVFNNTGAAGIDNEWQVDHAVQVVGYGYDKVLNANYWIVRNSWSTLWGEDGFIRLWRAPEGQPEPCSPSGISGQPTVCGTSGILYDVSWPIVYQADPTMFG